MEGARPPPCPTIRRAIATVQTFWVVSVSFLQSSWYIHTVNALNAREAGGPWFYLTERGRDGEREKGRDRETKRHTHRDRDTYTHKREREREGSGERREGAVRGRERDRQRQRVSELTC